MVVTVPAPGATSSSIQFGLLKRNGAMHSQSQKKQDALRLMSGKVSIDIDGSEPIAPDGKVKASLRPWWAGHGD
ncbi:hypothetical protein U8Q05_29985 (plasmid) [Rhizobium ruizarguesonis]|nr:hypothetical protein U8Q05_29985 [Rhizobium ruizarguesonis]